METRPKFLKWALVMGIVIVLNLFFNYTISLFYKEPDFNSYFSRQQIIEPITTKKACLEVGGQWTEGIYKEVPSPQGKEITGYCNPDFTKQQEYETARKSYERNVFIVLIILGVFSLLLGFFIPNEIVTLGLSWGGVLSLIIASIRYWSTADNVVKVLILACALALLIYVAIKKFSLPKAQSDMQS